MSFYWLLEDGSGTWDLEDGTGRWLLESADPSLIPGSLRVMAVSAGYYNGILYNAGDVFDLLAAGDYADSTQNLQNPNNYGVGWMLSVPATTPLYTWESATQPAMFPAVDPARRFVL